MQSLEMALFGRKVVGNRGLEHVGCVRIRIMRLSPMLEAGRRRASVGLDVRYHVSDPGDIGLPGQLNVFPTTRVTIPEGAVTRRKQAIGAT